MENKTIIIIINVPLTKYDNEIKIRLRRRKASECGRKWESIVN